MKRGWPALVATAAVLLLSAPQALASRTASTRADLLASPALQPITATPALAPTYVPQGFALHLDADAHPATFAIFNDLAPASEHVEPEKLASGVESWALTPNLQLIQIVVTDSRWCREFLGPIDSPNLYQAFGLDPMNMTDPLGLAEDDPACVRNENCVGSWNWYMEKLGLRARRGEAAPADPGYADAAEVVAEKERQQREVGATTRSVGKVGGAVGDTAIRAMPGPGTLIGLAEAREDARAGRWGAAALGVVAAGLDVVPGVGKVDDAVRVGRRLRTAGTRFERAAAEGADGLRCARSGKVWSLHPWDRGRVIEEAVTKEYEAKGWFALDDLTRSRNWELVDFQKGDTLVSLKSVETAGTTWLSRMQAHIEDLGTRGATVGDRPATMVLDLRVQPGGTGAAQSLVDYGAMFGVAVRVSEYP